MNPSRIFISHSSKDKVFANLVVAELRSPDMAPWIDSEQIIAGEDIFDQMGHGLRLMDVLAFLVSSASLASEWVDLEVKYAIKREITEKRILVLPFIIDDTPTSELPWFLSHRNASRVTQDASGAYFIVNTVRQALERKSATAEHEVDEKRFKSDPRVEDLIKNVNVSDWDAAHRAAIEALKATEDTGQNGFLESLLRYLDCPNDDLRWGTIMTVESFAQLAPWLFDHKIIGRIASHHDASIRSVAASICMDLAQFVPAQVPTDILLKLAAHDEDWYVMAPATAALKAMARSRPAVLHVFFERLHSSDSGVREHAARALADIAKEEPEILEPGQLKNELSTLEKMGDRIARELVTKALGRVKQAKHIGPYKYGL